jgi:hypothetical protein
MKTIPRRETDAQRVQRAVTAYINDRIALRVSCKAEMDAAAQRADAATGQAVQS